MKHTLIGLLVLAALLTAGDWELEPRASVTMYTDAGSMVVVDSSITSLGSLKFSTGATVLWGGMVGMYFDTDVFADKASGINFRPLTVDFKCGVFYRITDRVSVSYEHLCGHSIGNYKEKPLGYYSGYNSFSISYGATSR